MVGDNVASKHIQVGAFGIDYSLQTLQSALARLDAVVAPVNVGELRYLEAAIVAESHAASALSRCYERQSSYCRCECYS